MECFKKGYFYLTLLVSIVFLSCNVFAITDEEVAAAIAGGQQWLINDQAEDGSWTDDMMGNPVATTALVVAALLETGMDKTNPAIVDGIDYILDHVQADGGIYDSSGYANYINACALIALSLYGDTSDEYREIVQNAVDFTLARQVGIGGTPDEYVNYGGRSYGTTIGTTSADMSNTQFFVMGLWYAYRYLGIPTANTDWAERLLVYLERSHGWEDSSDQAWANGKTTRGTDGAFSYHTHYASFYPGGSMTGAGIWSLGMIGEDQNEMVNIALDWFAENYTWERNAGDYYSNSPTAAYYYYVYTMSKALTAVRDTQFEINGNKWVEDIKAAMLDDDRMITVPGTDPAQVYWEGGGSLDGRKQLPTAYVLMSLAFADPSVESPKKLLAQPQNWDNPIKGLISLEVRDGAVIALAERGLIGDAQKGDFVGLPLGGFRFRVSRIDGDTVELRIQAPAEAFNPDNPHSFINEDGTLKRGLGWFTIVGNPRWELIPSVPVEIDRDANLIRVTLTDGGPEDQGDVPGEILIDSFSAVGYVEGSELSLTPGWNLISLPLQPDDTGIGSVLNEIDGTYSSVWAYDAGAWDAYFPEAPGMSDLLEMEAGIGYWINMDEAASLIVSGSTPDKSIGLERGWNLVGYNTGNAMGLKDALDSIDRKYISAWGYEDGLWLFYSPNPNVSSTLDQMKPGYGYWINTTEGVNWTLP